MSVLRFFVVLLPILFSAVSNAAGYGEFNLTVPWGGTSFSDQVVPAEHKRAWDFGKNVGLALGLKGGLHSDLIGLGISAEFGYKEDAFERIAGGGSSHYYNQSTRFLAGAYLMLSPLKKGAVHFYFGYDPLVMAEVFHSKDDAANPFEKGDRMKGIAYTFGVGVNKSDFLLRMMARRVYYKEADFKGVKHTLPDSSYSELTTDEFIIQLGTSF
jgi:hypothetical protein